MSIFNKIFGCGTASCVKLDEYNLAELKSRGVIVLDVRTPSEYASGHIAEAQNTPLQSLKNYVDQIKAADKPVITYCRSGKRSELARTILSAQGVEVYNAGGYSDFVTQWESVQA